MRKQTFLPVPLATPLQSIILLRNLIFAYDIFALIPDIPALIPPAIESSKIVLKAISYVAAESGKEVVNTAKSIPLTGLLPVAAVPGDITAAKPPIMLL